MPKKITLLLSDDQHVAFLRGAKNDGFSSLSEWMRVRLQERVPKSVGRPVLTPEEKKKKDREKYYFDEYLPWQKGFENLDNPMCLGSGKWVPIEKREGDFDLAFGKCKVCSRDMAGIEETEKNVKLREHHGTEVANEEFLRPKKEEGNEL